MWHKCHTGCWGIEPAGLQPGVCVCTQVGQVTWPKIDSLNVEDRAFARLLTPHHVMAKSVRRRVTMGFYSEDGQLYDGSVHNLLGPVREFRVGNAGAPSPVRSKARWS